MRPRTFSFCLMAVTIGGLFAQAAFGGRVMAQAEKLTWDRETNVPRVAKKNRKPARPRRAVERAPLLTLEYRVMKQDEELVPREANPQSVFYTGDRLQIRIKANQDGYLYIIQNTEKGDGQIIFPDSRIDGGRNLVKKNEEHVIPARCEKQYIDERGNCWFWMEPPAGSEVFTVIFSRDLITDLSDKLIDPGGKVKRKVIDELLADSAQTLKRTSRPNQSAAKGGGAGQFIIWVTNTNRKDNEELITDITLLHKEREGSPGK
ncbi:MAG TPA: DUF4384 domain-containing protein [Blastocatellia bacterium]|nr:DUF4384 domain-containing protein [Blastocatellia bacterium]